MDDSKETILSLSSFDTTLRRYEGIKQNKLIPCIKETQQILKQVSISNYLINYSKESLSSNQLIETLNQIRQPSTPATIIKNNLYLFYLNKITTLQTTYQKDFLEAIINYSKHNKPHYIQYFCIVTFPAFFFHFMTQEFEKLGFIFISSLIKSLPLNISDDLMYGFIIQSFDFQSCLWKLFDEFVWENVTQRTSEGQYFYPLMLAFTKAVHLLTFYQKTLLLNYHSKNPANFSIFFMKKFLLSSYNIYHSTKLDAPNEINPLEEFTNYITTIGQSTHFDLLFSVLCNSKQFRDLPLHAMFNGNGDAPIVVSEKDLFILQLILQSSDKKSLEIPNSFLIDQIQDPYSPVMCKTMLFMNKDDITFLQMGNSTNNYHVFQPIITPIPKPQFDKSQQNDELNERLKCVANQTGFPGSLTFVESRRQGNPYARKEREQLSEQMNKEVITYIHNLDLVKNIKRMEKVESYCITNLYYLDEINKLNNKLRNHLKLTLYHLLGSLYQSDYPKIDPVLTTCIQTRELKSSPVVQTDAQCWAVLRYKDCFNYVDTNDISDYLGSNRFQSIDGGLDHPLYRVQRSSSNTKDEIKESSFLSSGLLTNPIETPSVNSKVDKKRRNSFDATKSVTAAIQMDLMNKLKMVNKRDQFLQFLICIRTFDQRNIDDIRLPKLRQQYLRLVDSERIKKFSIPSGTSKKKHYKFDQFEDCFRVITKMIDELALTKKGSALMKMADISLRIQQVADDCAAYYYPYKANITPKDFFKSQKSISIEKSNDEVLQNIAKSIFHHCLILSETDAFYVAFIWEQKMMSIFPTIKDHSQSLYLNIIRPLQFIETAFYNFLKKDPTLYEKTHDLRVAFIR